jgi:hypothetical protein
MDVFVFIIFPIISSIIASSRLREAAAEKAEAEKILKVKAAEAEAESKYLSGMGVARQRKAIINGLQETVQTFSEDVHGAGAKDVMDLLLLTQYFDTIREIARNRQNNVLFLPHGPRSVEALKADLAHSFAMLSSSGTNSAASSSRLLPVVNMPPPPTGESTLNESTALMMNDINTDIVEMNREMNQSEAKVNEFDHHRSPTTESKF